MRLIFKRQFRQVLLFIGMIANYNQLTIKQFLNCKRISELEADPIDKNVRLLAEITGKEVDDIESLPIGELKEQLKKLGELDKECKEIMARIEREEDFNKRYPWL